MAEQTKQRFGAVLPIVLLGYFLILMDNSVVFSSSLSIARELGMDSVAVSWVSTAYALTFGGFLLLGGRLGDIIGRRRIFLAGLAVFTAASFLVGSATSGNMLVAMRALQGMGSSMLAPSTLALLIDNYEGQMRTRSIAAYGTVAGIGSSVGMVLGGFITAYASWRYAFYIDVPVGILLIVLTLRFIPAKSGSNGSNVDWAGAILSVIGFAGLVYGIDGRVGREVSIVIAVVALVALVLRERRAQVPLMPLRLFGDLGRSAAYVGRFLMMGASMSYFFLMPTALQQVYGFTPLMAAVGFLPLTVTQFFSSLTVPALTRRFSNARVLILGSVIDALGLFLGWGVGVQAGYLLGVAVPMVLIGMGQALIVSPLTVAGVAGASEDISGAASGVVNVFHQVGAAVGLAAVSMAVSGMQEVAAIDAAQGMMLLMIVLTGVCGFLVLASEQRCLVQALSDVE
ncbi:MFS transporter [Parafannyhessea umbonata]|uniref:Drug resistance transporter, EmrB/QacA subfamily n=1 Tax=Parafannyhessea umbonata TaxID=604330 RepID=A0A1G6MMP1_9ACTN|nr:MFS transporter [Parafannyhessea umbonata]SDC56789.1 drug resistance transporter, EmrB/QacA subfamily [Parafannyhessea umbonata]